MCDSKKKKQQITDRPIIVLVFFSTSFKLHDYKYIGGLHPLARAFLFPLTFTFDFYFDSVVYLECINLFANNQC